VPPGVDMCQKCKCVVRVFFCMCGENIATCSASPAVSLVKVDDADAERLCGACTAVVQQQVCAVW
jgi:hypothetical protein